MTAKHFIKVKGEVNGATKLSIYSMNPKGWIGVTVCIGFPLDEDETLEQAFIKAVKETNPIFPVGMAQNIEITYVDCI